MKPKADFEAVCNASVKDDAAAVRHHIDVERMIHLGAFTSSKNEASRAS
jgi:hypothetical protein